MTLRKALRASTALTVVSILGMAATVSLSIFDEAKAQTWNGATQDYGTATNWTPNDVPDAAGESATFNGAGADVVDLGGNTFSVDGWNVSGGTTYSMENGTVNFLTAAGLTNTSSGGLGINANITGIGGVTQNGTATLFLLGNNTYTGGTNVLSGIVEARGTGTLGTGAVVVGDPGGGASAVLQLTNGFNAQSLDITNNTTGNTVFDGGNAGSATIRNSQGGGTTFMNNSTAGNATITNDISAGQPSVTLFTDTSTAGNARFLLPGGDVRFEDSSTAGDAQLSGTATIIFSENATGGNAQISLESFTGLIQFLDNSTAGAATILNDTGSQIRFDGTGTSAGTATITNSGSSTSPAVQNSTTIFDTTSTAGSARITNISDGRTQFLGSSTAGNATITNDVGGGTFFEATSTGDNAQLVTIGTGFVDFSRSAIAANRAGSISGSGELRLGSIDFTVGSNNLSTTYSGVIQDGGTNGGTGASLTKTGTGTLTLSGINTYTGGTTVNQGTLSVNGTIGAVNVLSGATLGGIGTVGNTVVVSGATIAPGNSIGTLNVAGDITLDAGSIYSVELAGSGASDLIAASGVATLQGGSVAVTALDPQTSYQTGQVYRILTAQGGVSGAFDPSVLSNSAFLSATLANTANAVDLTIVVAPTPPNPPGPPPVFVTAAQTRNQLATAGALDTLVQSGSSLALYNSLLVLDAATAREAFDSLSGEIYASTKTALIEDSRFIRDAAINRVRSSFGGVATPALPIMAHGEGGPELAPATTDKFGVWGTGFGNWGSTDSDGNAASLDRTTGGFVIGADALVWENWRLGLLAGYSRTSFDVDDRSSSGDSDNYHLGIYGGTQWGNLGFRAGAAYTWSNIDTHRSVEFPGFSEDLNADYDAGTAQVFGELGYRIDTSRVAFEPFANLAYVNFRSDSFSESGGAAALSASSETTDTTFTTLGLRASTDFTMGSMSATARGMLGWRHAFDDVTPQSRLAFTGSDAFTISGVPIDKDAFAVEAGLDLKITHSATLGVSYNGQFGSKAIDNGFKADLSFKF
ncbi:outer membrane autotransporter protein [Phyllobacterium sp. 1468]|uniref:autotransporter outer membrane beta-barrel domain-containing protein n=1 Tax=Phyllobacterium sp. 1468 TaxID=2817759 RepID=UPI002855C3E6|nr:autotransporter domain-containing protein [Phyllobacterium sp. 1468]MDR6634080.1 outer membrane autotransporter protein [Phyllobacterium sp. 1468]